MTVKEITKMKKKERAEKRKEMALKKKKLEIIIKAIESFDKLLTLATTVFTGIIEAGEIITTQSFDISINSFIITSITLIISGSVVSGFIGLKVAELESDIEEMDKVTEKESK